MNRTIDKYKLTILTVATLSSMSVWSPSTAVASSDAESGGAGSSTASSTLTGTAPRHTIAAPVKPSASQAVRTAKKPFKMRYGNVMRAKPADPSNFGLLKSYCSHSHGKRWNTK